MRSLALALKGTFFAAPSGSSKICGFKLGEDILSAPFFFEGIGSTTKFYELFRSAINQTLCCKIKFPLLSSHLNLVCKTMFLFEFDKNIIYRK